jgi:hypothetical protein
MLVLDGTGAFVPLLCPVLRVSFLNRREHFDFHPLMFRQGGGLRISVTICLQKH